jgi:hypothetical protein
MTAAKVDITKRYKTPKGVLRAVLRLFEESPSNWTRHMRYRARKTANGGTAFCATGGIEHFAANPTAARQAKELLRDALGGKKAVEEINDRRGRKAILAGLKKALA